MRLFYILLLFILNILSSNCYAQSVTLSKEENRKVTKEEVIILDTCQIQLIYKYKDTLNDGVGSNMLNNEFRIITQVGKNITKFVDEREFIIDSLQNIAVQQGLTIEDFMNQLLSIMPRKKAFREKLYINYPTGKITTRVSLLGSFRYEEGIPNIRWKLSSDTTIIHGYKCKKATCSLFGRDYEVWYTPLIPVSAGPWKFKGLPGLIIKASDSKKEVSFECVSIQFPKGSLITFPKKQTNTIVTTKKDFYNLYKKHLDDPGSIIKARGVEVIGNEALIPKKKKRKEVFLELDM